MNEQVLEPSRVLIAEDDATTARIFATALQKAGFLPEVVHSGEEALVLLRGDTVFAAVVLDIGLPGLDGRDVLASLQREESAHPTPVMVVSGRDDDNTRALVLRLGARDVMSKPVYPSQLVNRIKRMVESP